MLVHRDEQHQQAEAAVCRSEAAAELVATTLAVHGIRADVGPVSRVYPSLDWVAGYRVVVAEADRTAARDLLALLADHDDVAVLDVDTADDR